MVDVETQNFDPVTPPAQRERGFGSAIRFVLCAMVAFATILFGAVDSVTWSAIYAFWGVLVLLWLGDSWRRGGILFSTDRILLPVAGLLIIGVLQLLPLPLIGSLDPAATFYFDLRLLVLLTFFAACLTFIDNEARLRRAVHFVVIFGALIGFYGILQRLASPESIYGVRHPGQAIPFGPFVNQHHFAALMEMTGGVTLAWLFGASTSRDQRILLATAAVIMGAAVGFTGSRGGLLSFGAVLVFVLLFRVLSGSDDDTSTSRSKLWIAAGGLSMLMLIFSTVLYLGGNDTLLRGTGIAMTDVDVSTGRFHFWPIALKIFFSHPILGAGFDAFGVAFTRYDTWPGLFRVEQAHNDYLQMLADGGVAAFACTVAFIALLFRGGMSVVAKGHDWRKYTATGALAGCFGLLVHSFFDFPLRTNSNSFVFLLLVTIAVVPVYGEQRRCRRSRPTSRLPSRAETRTAG